MPLFPFRPPVYKFCTPTHFHSAHNQASALTIRCSVSNDMHWLNINFELFGIFLRSPWALEETSNSGTY